MSIAKFVHKFRYAIRGLVYLWQHEPSWRWQVVAACLVQIIAWYLQLNAVVWGLLTLTSAVVLSVEAFNTVLECLFDIIEPRLSAQVGLLKNLLAAAVLLVAVGAVLLFVVVLAS